MSRELRIGDDIVDNDPRMGKRVLQIVSVGDVYVQAIGWPFNRTYRIQKRRIHTDGKPRKSGFSFVEKTL